MHTTKTIRFKAYVKVKKDVPAFVDEYGQTWGTFKAGDVALLPIHVAWILAVNKYVVPTEINGKLMVHEDD